VSKDAILDGEEKERGEAPSLLEDMSRAFSGCTGLSSTKGYAAEPGFG
jgi:hypothetical protein